MLHFYCHMPIALPLSFFLVIFSPFRSFNVIVKIDFTTSVQCIYSKLKPGVGCPLRTLHCRLQTISHYDEWLGDKQPNNDSCRFHARSSFSQVDIDLAEQAGRRPRDYSRGPPVGLWI